MTETSTGQTRIRVVGGGLIGVLEQSESHVGGGRGSANVLFRLNSTARNLHRQGETANVDRIVVP